VADFECGDASEFGFKVRQGTKEETVIGYDVRNQKMFVDRTRSGRVDFNPSFPARNLAPLMPVQNIIRLHVFVDECSVEVFGNDGRTVISDEIFPDPSSDGLSLYSVGGSARLAKLDVWRLGSIWKK
jgi:fructan beta-fructosidase